MNPNKKIAIVGTVASSIYGFRSDMIKSLIAKGYEVFAFTSEYIAEDLDKIKALGAIPVTYKLNRGGLNPLSDIKATYGLAKKIKNISPDIVFVYASKATIFGTLAAKLAKVPKVIGMLEGLGHSFTEQPQGQNKKTIAVKSIQVLLYKVALPKLDAIIFLNNDDPKDLLEAYHIKVKRVEILGGIGLNLDDYKYRPVSYDKEQINFLFIGRLLKEKGIYEFIEAAKLVKSNYPNANFIVLGSIDKQNLGSLTQHELDHLVATGIIDYPGHVDDIHLWIQKSDVFVLPSYREGIPRSTQEAMAVGRAIITTDVPGCRETVVDGVNGFLVEKWNPKALAEKMIYFVENPDQIHIMGKESYKIAQENFDAEKVNQRLLKMMGL